MLLSMSQAGDGSSHGVSRVAIVVVPCILTGLAFSVLRHFNAVGNLPLALILGLLFVGGGFVTKDASWLTLHVAIGAEVLGVTAIIYAIGWGPTLTVGYLFVIARVL